jgi:hypothetical protein
MSTILNHGRRATLRSRASRSLGVGIGTLIGAAALAACSSSSAAVDDVSAEAALRSSEQGTILLEQGWNDADREAWARLSDGSGLVPLPWLGALEVADTDAMFLSDENVRKFGFITAPRSATNPFGLPVGLAIQPHGLGPMPMVGSNCAGCHEAELTYKGATIRIHGGQGAGRISEFVGAAFQALGVALKSLATSDRSKFERFAAHVFQITGQANTFTGPDGDAKREAATQQLIAGVRGTLAKISATAEFDAAHGISPRGWGPYRSDAVESGANVIGTKLTIDNRVPLDAPVSLPFLWDTPTFDWVEYNSSFRQPTGRNLISVLARNADISFDADPAKAFTNSVELANVIAFEKLTMKLRSPRWPEQVLGKLDHAKAQEGRKLYAAKCAGCHDPGKDTDGFLAIKLIPLAEIGTDPNQAEHMAKRSFDMKGFQGQTTLNLGQFSKLVTDGVVMKNRTPDLDREMLATDGVRQNEFRAPLAYRARPLDGIWATAPYLHNGSVPNLRELLLPEEQRSKKFSVGNPELDPVDVGLVSTSGSFELDTSLPGNHNTGHSGPAYGTDLGAEDRGALIEYLKSL